MSWLETIVSDTASANTLSRDFPWAEAMIGCPHDSAYHSEGCHRGRPVLGEGLLLGP